MSREPPRNEPEELCELLRKELGSTWSIKVRNDPASESFVIWLKHPLTVDLTLMLRHGSTKNREVVAGKLESAEVTRIMDAPAVLPNAGLLGSIRATAAAGHWPPTVLGELASVLSLHQLLTDDEARWLAFAGPAEWE